MKAGADEIPLNFSPDSFHFNHTAINSTAQIQLFLCSPSVIFNICNLEQAILLFVPLEGFTCVRINFLFFFFVTDITHS